MTDKEIMTMVLVKRVFLSLLALLTLPGFMSGQSKALPPDQPPSISIYKKRYVNYPYGYRFEIPWSLRGECSAPPAPQHGVAIDLPGKSERPRNIVFFASYDATDLLSLDKAVKDAIAELQRKSVFELRVKKAIQLGGLSAVKLKYRLDGQPGEQVIAYRRLKGDSVIYQGWLKSTNAYYIRDAKTFTRMLASWRFGPLQ